MCMFPNQPPINRRPNRRIEVLLSHTTSLLSRWHPLAYSNSKNKKINNSGGGCKDQPAVDGLRWPELGLLTHVGLGRQASVGQT